MPNKCPFKAELLAEAEKQRDSIKVQKEQKKLDRKTLHVNLKKIGEKSKMNGTSLLKDLKNLVNFFYFNKRIVSMVKYFN